MTRAKPFSWFELPVSDLTRAATFYETILKIDIQKIQFENVLMGWIPSNEEGKGTSGAYTES